MHVEHTVWVPAELSAEDIFEFLAAFDNAVHWDPTVRSAARVAGTSPGVGSKFDLVVAFGPSKVPMRYETTAFESPSRLGLRGVSRFSVAEDDIRLEPVDDGTHIRWSLTVSFRGGAQLLSPLMCRVLRPSLERLGVEAMTGLAGALGGRLLT